MQQTKHAFSHPEIPINSSVINSGMIMNYSYRIVRFEKRRALEFFSQGV